MPLLERNELTVYGNGEDSSGQPGCGVVFDRKKELKKLTKNELLAMIALDFIRACVLQDEESKIEGSVNKIGKSIIFGSVNHKENSDGMHKIIDDLSNSLLLNGEDRIEGFEISVESNRSTGLKHSNAEVAGDKITLHGMRDPESGEIDKLIVEQIKGLSESGFFESVAKHMSHFGKIIHIITESDVPALTIRFSENKK